MRRFVHLRWCLKGRFVYRTRLRRRAVLRYTALQPNRVAVEQKFINNRYSRNDWRKCRKFTSHTGGLS